MLTVERDLQAQPENSPSGPLILTEPLHVARRKSSSSDMQVIVESLEQCATAFGTDRARFMRQTTGGEWTVHTLHQGLVTSHIADQAEIAMAWMVGLSRFPIRVTRPRVIQADGSGIRPIAVTTYLGIPVLCQNHFAGVIELAGSDTGELERVLGGLNEMLARLGYRLIHDPAIRATQHIDMDVECGLSGGFWNPDQISLSTDEWTVLSALGSPGLLREIAAMVPLSDERLIEVLHMLVSRGLVSIRATTRTLSGTREPERVSSAVRDAAGE